VSGISRRPTSRIRSLSRRGSLRSKLTVAAQEETEASVQARLIVERQRGGQTVMTPVLAMGSAVSGVHAVAMGTGGFWGVPELLLDTPDGVGVA